MHDWSERCLDGGGYQHQYRLDLTVERDPRGLRSYCIETGGVNESRSG